MSSNREPACLDETLHWEGGYSNDPYDPGGMTMHGIIQREYDAYRDRKGKPRQWVKLIERDEELEIYKTGYWDKVDADELPDGVDLAMFDYAVNSGPGRAIMSAQAALGLPIDGVMGPATRVALRSADPIETINKIMDARLAFLQRLNTWWRFGQGWSRRCAGVRHAALEAAGHAMTQPKPEPHANEDKQAASQARAYGPLVIPAADGPTGYDYAQEARKTKPPVAATAAKSKTVGATVLGGLLWLAQVFKDVINGFFDNITNMISEIDANLDSLKTALGWFQAEWEPLAFKAAILCSVIVIVRHIILKQQAQVANAIPSNDPSSA